MKDQIKSYIEKKEGLKVSVTKGEDPPDYYFEIGSEKIAVEITQLVEQKRRTADIATILWERYLKEFEDKIPPDEWFLIRVKNPLTNHKEARKVKNKIKKSLKKMIENPQTEILQIRINEEEVAIIKRGKGPRNGKKILISSKWKKPPSMAPLSEELISELEFAIRKKRKNLKKINMKKWLGILSQENPLFDTQLFNELDKSRIHKMCFERIFIVVAPYGKEFEIVEI